MKKLPVQNAGGFLFLSMLSQCPSGATLLLIQHQAVALCYEPQHTETGVFRAAEIIAHAIVPHFFFGSQVGQYVNSTDQCDVILLCTGIETNAGTIAFRDTLDPIAAEAGTESDALDPVYL